MNRNVESHFSMLPKVDISRSRFDRSHSVKLSFNVGDVVNVTSSIVGAPFDTEFLQTVSDGNRVVWLVGDDVQLKEFVRNDVVLYNCGIETVIEPVEE